MWLVAGDEWPRIFPPKIGKIGKHEKLHEKHEKLGLYQKSKKENLKKLQNFGKTLELWGKNWKCGKIWKFDKVNFYHDIKIKYANFQFTNIDLNSLFIKVLI